MKVLVMKKELLASIAYNFVYMELDCINCELNKIISCYDKAIINKFNNNDGFYYYDFKSVMEFRKWLYEIFKLTKLDYCLKDEDIEFMIENIIKEICKN